MVDGTQYELDLLVYASGFEVTTGLVSRLGFDPVGRDGVRLSERWDDGAHTLHGVLTNGFPNLLVCHFIQAGFGLNFHHYLSELTTHLASIVATAAADDIVSIEATVEARGRVARAALGGGQGLRPLLRLLHAQLPQQRGRAARWPPPATSCTPAT